MVRLDQALGTCNHTPQAVVIASPLVGKNQTVMLDASGSNDRGGDELDATWTLIEVPPMSIAQVDPIDALRARLKPDREGTYVVELVVNDGVLSSAPVLHRLLVTNQAPTANAGGDVSGLLDVAIQLNGSGTDPDGDLLTYTWTLNERPPGSNAQLAGTSYMQTSLTPDVLGIYRASLVVNDGSVDSIADEIQIAGGVTGGSPVADAGPDIQANAFEVVQLDGSRSLDPDGDTLTYRWQVVNRPSGSSATLVDEFEAVARLTLDVIGDYDLELLVSDGFFTARDSVKINAAPIQPWGIGDLFDPTELYMIARLDAVRHSRVLIPVATPNFYSFGFSGGAGTLQMNHEGRMRHMSYNTNFGPAGIFEFVQDAPGPGSNPVPFYPDAPWMNDIQIPYACTTPHYERHVAGSDGNWIYCYDFDGWLHEDGRQYLTEDESLVAASGDVLLFRSGKLVYLSGAPSIGASLPGTIGATRVTPTGFLVAITWFSAGGDAELWEIRLDGTTTKVGNYPPDPRALRRDGYVLGPLGGLFTVEVDANNIAAIYKLNVNGPVEVVAERRNTINFGVYLLTGP